MGFVIRLDHQGVKYSQDVDGAVTDVSTQVDPDSRDFSVDTSPDAPNAFVIDEINSRILQPARAPLVGLMFILVTAIIGSLTFVVQANPSQFRETIYPILSTLPLAVAVIVLMLGLWITRRIHGHDKLARLTSLQYELDDATKEKFITVQTALANLGKSACIWLVVSRVPTWDLKRSFSATSLVTRRKISVSHMRPPFIDTKIKVYGIALDSLQLFFLPDQTYALEGNQYRPVTYDSLQVDVSTVSFIETESVPSDSTIISRTWQHVKKDGGPDLRYKSNRQVPIVYYGYLEIVSQSGLDLHLYISNVSYAQQFALALNQYIKYQRTPHPGPSNKESSDRREAKSEVR